MRGLDGVGCSSGAGTCYVCWCWVGNGCDIRIPVDTVKNPLGSVCYPPHSPFLHEFHVSCLVHGLHGVWCSFQGLVCVNSAGVALGRDGT